MTEKEELGIGASLFELREFEIENFAWGALLENCLLRITIAWSEGTQGGGKNGAALLHAFWREWQERNGKVAIEGIRDGAQDGNIVVAINGNHGGLHEAWRRTWRVKKKIGLTTVELGQDVCNGEEVAFSIDEKGVAVEKITIAARRRGAINLVDNGAKRSRENAIVRG